MINDVLAFFSNDPVVAWLLVGSAGFVIAGFILGGFMLWADRELAKPITDRIIQRASEPIRYPPPQGPKTDQPWQKTRKSA